MADDYQQYIPLSVWMFDIFFHPFQFVPRMISLIIRALGRKGTFTKRKRSPHNNHNSIVGVRAENSAAQPSPSEGPKEEGYCYFRSWINMTCWPFVLQATKRLSNRITGKKCVRLVAFFRTFWLTITFFALL